MTGSKKRGVPRTRQGKKTIVVTNVSSPVSHSLRSGVGEGSKMNSLYLRLKEKIRAIRENETNKSVEISNVKFEGAVKKDLEEHCGFFDYSPLTSFLCENFHLAHPTIENTALFRLNWNASSQKVLGVHFLLAALPEGKLDIWVLEVFDLAERSKQTSSLKTVKTEFTNLSKKGILTGVQELVKFAVRILTGG